MEQKIMDYVELKAGDQVRVRGKLKKVVDFLATSDKETLRLLASFFEEGCDPVVDAKRLQKPHAIARIYKDTLEISINRGSEVWEEKKEYFERTEEVSDGTNSTDC